MSNFEENVSTKGINKILSRNNIILIYTILVAITIAIIIAAIIAFYFNNKNKETIQNGIYIKGIDVSLLTKQEAISKVESKIKEQMGEHVIFKYKNCEYYVEPEQFNANFDINSAVEYAYNLGKSGNIIQDIKDYSSILFNNINIEPTFNYDKEALEYYLQGIQEQLPDQLEQSSYYLDGNDLIITSGKNGAVIYNEKIENLIIEDIKNLNYSNSIYELPTETVYPEKVDVQAIHEDIYQKMENAYYTTNPYMIYADRQGVDFNIEEVENYIEENPAEYEYKIGLTITKPEVTIKDIGIEAFPDILGTFSTKYVNNANRTTNLRLAASKINSKVIMPGEEFSFNKTVGQRTRAAGYRDAAIFVNGKTEDGLAGGICQISTTLYNAVTLANLDVIERRNHSLLTSYSQPGRDATVVWGSSDLKFKNTRNYPVKLYFSVSNGLATCSVYGLKTDDEYDISFETKTIKKTSKTMVVDTYLIYKQNGTIVKKSKLHRDTYKL